MLLNGTGCKRLTLDGRVSSSKILGLVTSCQSGLPQMVGYCLQGYWNRWRQAKVAHLRWQDIVYKDIGTGGVRPKWLTSDGRVSSTKILRPVASGQSDSPQMAGYHLQRYWDQWRQAKVAHLRWQGIVDKDIGTSGVRPKRPDGASSEQIPVVLGLKELAEPFPWPRDLHDFVLNVLRQPLLQGLSNHRQLVPGVGNIYIEHFDAIINISTKQLKLFEMMPDAPTNVGSMFCQTLQLHVASDTQEIQFSD